MEILNFYGVNIIAGSLLVILLGLIGTHAIARNKSLDVMLLGQEFQTSILISALLLNGLGFFEHDDHGAHFETLMSLGFVVLFHIAFSKMLKNKNQYKVEASIVGIVLLMGIGQLVVSLSPSIEFHMVKSFIGDIVTVSKSESIIVSIVALISLFIFLFYRKLILKDSIEIALFNRITSKKKSYYIYSVLLVISMLSSIHLFGSLFTIGTILIPSFICTFFGINVRQMQHLNFITWISVPISFFLLSYNDRIPNTVTIIGLITMISCIFCFIKKRL